MKRTSTDMHLSIQRTWRVKKYLFLPCFWSVSDKACALWTLNILIEMIKRGRTGLKLHHVYGTPWLLHDNLKVIKNADTIDWSLLNLEVCLLTKKEQSIIFMVRDINGVRENINQQLRKKHESYKLICKSLNEINIWSPTSRLEYWLPQTGCVLNTQLKINQSINYRYIWSQRMCRLFFHSNHSNTMGKNKKLVYNVRNKIMHTCTGWNGVTS